MIRYLWQLPQHLLALLLLSLFRGRIVSRSPGAYGTVIIRLKGVSWGASLGHYILIDSMAYPRTVIHEQGHSCQSLMLGPFYLLLVGIPSFTMALLTALGVLKAENYYKRWPESWADELGGVKR